MPSADAGQELRVLIDRQASPHALRSSTSWQERATKHIGVVVHAHAAIDDATCHLLAAAAASSREELRVFVYDNPPRRVNVGLMRALDGKTARGRRQGLPQVGKATHFRGAYGL